jgi:hypothetical protein
VLQGCRWRGIQSRHGHPAADGIVLLPYVPRDRLIVTKRIDLLTTGRREPLTLARRGPDLTSEELPVASGVVTLDQAPTCQIWRADHREAAHAPAASGIARHDATTLFSRLRHDEIRMHRRHR